jgi:hypothetical protein
MANEYQIFGMERVQLTDAEQAEVDARRKETEDNAPTLRMKQLRKQRDALLVETDYMGNSDVTMSDAWKTYRQALRDITKQTPTDDMLSNITFPTKPTE